MTQHLYTTTDVRKVREKLLKEQGGRDAITGIIIPNGKAVCDHNHTTQYVRAVLHRQTNAFMGKLENGYIRYLKSWYNGTLSDFLRQAAAYLERPDNLDYLHPGWVKKSQTLFNSCSEPQKKDILSHLNLPTGANAVERKKLFQQAIQSKQFTFDFIRELIERIKNDHS